MIRAVLATLLGVAVAVPSPMDVAAKELPDAPLDTWTTNGDVYSVLHHDGTVYIGGSFDVVGPRSGYFAKIDALTGAATPFPEVAGGQVHAVVSDGSGGWYIGGEFTYVGGVARNHVAHVLSDGTVDATWNPNADSTVGSLAVSADGSTIYAGGWFTNIEGQARSKIAALNDITGAARAGAGWVAGADVRMLALALSPDGSALYAGGGFTAIGGQGIPSIAKLDPATGAADNAWNAAGANGFVNAIAVQQSSGDVVVGGLFTTVGGLTRDRIALLDAATGVPSGAFTPNSAGAVNALIFTNAGEIYLGGQFTTVHATARNRIAKLNTTGVLQGWNSDADDTVNALALDSITVYAGGLFRDIGGISRGRIAALDATTDSNNASVGDPDASGQVRALAVSGGGVFAGGNFVTFGGSLRSNLAAIDPVSGALTSWNPGVNGIVRTLAASGTTLYIGGDFTTVAGQARARLAALRTDSDTLNTTSWNPGASGSVLAFALSPDGGILYVGGDFDTGGGPPSIGGSSIEYLAALRTDIDTNNTTAWIPAAAAAVRALALDGAILYVGGDFGGADLIGGADRDFIAALRTDVDTNNATSWNPGAGNIVRALALDGQTLYAGGAFFGAGSTPAAVSGQADHEPAEAMLPSPAGPTSRS